MASPPRLRRFHTAYSALAAIGLLLLALSALSSHTSDTTEASSATEPGSAAAAAAGAGLGSPLRRLLQSGRPAARPATRPMFAPSYRPVATSSYTRPATYRPSRPMGAGAAAGAGGATAVAAGVAQAQPGADTASIQIQFDNRGSKVEGKKDVLIQAVAKMLKVDPKKVTMNVIGQSGLLNHQSVATFSAVGPPSSGKSVYQNCVDVVKSGWFTSSTASKELNRASDSWVPGDSVKVEKATCSAPGQKQVTGR